MAHAHILYLQVAAGTGFPGYVAFWMVLGAWAGMAWDLLRPTRAGLPAAAHRPLALGLGLVGGVLAFLSYSVTDAVEIGEKAAVAFWALMALSVGLWLQVRPAAPAP